MSFMLLNNAAIRQVPKQLYVVIIIFESEKMEIKEMSLLNKLLIILLPI